MSPGSLAAPIPFDTARSMIEDMLMTLLLEAAEEAIQKDFCDKEIGKTKAIKDDDDIQHKAYGIDEFNTKEVDTTSKNREKEL